MASCYRGKAGSNERGASAVEFALVVPMLFGLVGGIVDLGFMINRDTMVNNAAREGAREGALNTGATAMDDLQCRVRRSLSTIETPSGDADCVPAGTPKVTLTITCRKPDTTACTGTFPTDAITGGTVVVRVDYLHSFITPTGTTLHSAPYLLTKTSEMRIE